MTNNTVVKGYKIDFTNNALVMNYKFSKQAMIYGTEEYNIRKNILADYPDMKSVVKAGREQTKPSKTRNLTYKNMRGYISVVCPKRKDDFEEAVIMSKIEKSPYKYMRNWFNENILNGESKDIVSEENENKKDVSEGAVSEENENKKDIIYSCPLAEVEKISA